MSIATTWGTTAEERALSYPCDALLPHGQALYRGVTVNAPPSIVFRWLCQMRVAPYSYDRLDNGGKQSPQELTPSLDELAVGQTVMRSFVIRSFDLNEHITVGLRPGAWEGFVSDVAATYAIRPQGETSRIIVKLLLLYRPGLVGRIMPPLIAWGDFVMMRKQLLNFKRLAEVHTARTVC
jgi:hypothetical protein